MEIEKVMGSKAHGPCGRSILRATHSILSMSQLLIIQNLEVLTRLCFSVTRLQTMELQGACGEVGWHETYRFTRAAS